ncbi:MAG: glycosyltransferase family 39 protein [Desulfarculaceae bacterium]
MKQTHLISKSLLVLIIIALGGCGLALASLSLAPPAFLKQWADAAAFDGSADYMTIPRLQAMQKLLLGAALPLLGAALMVVVLRRRVEAFLFIQAQSLAVVAAAAKGYVLRILKESPPAHLTILGLVIMLGLGLRLAFLWQPIDYDEATTFMEYASRPFYITLTYYSAPNNHVFYSLLVHISHRLFGDGLAAVRLPAFLAGLALIPATYLLVRHLYNQRAALLTAALCAGSPVMIFFSVDSRGYALMSLLFILLLLLSFYLRRHAEPAGWGLWALLASLGLFTIPTMLFPLAAILAWWLLSPLPGASNLGRRLQLKALCVALMGAAGLTLLFYTPVIIGSGLQSLFANQYVLRRPWSGDLLPGAAVNAWEFFTQGLPVWFSLTLAAAMLASLIFRFRRSITGINPGLALLLGCTAVLIAHGGQPPARTWLFAVPLGLGLAGCGLAWLGETLFSRTGPWRQGWVYVLSLMVIGGLSINPQLTSRPGFLAGGTDSGDLAQVADYLQGRYQPGDGVLTICPLDEPLAYYFRRRRMPISPIFLALSNGLHSCRRVWVVTKKKGYPSLQDCLKWGKIQPGGYTPPQLTAEYTGTRLYLLHKLKPALKENAKK